MTWEAISADRELLELAAKAAGIWDYAENCIDIPWNPLTDDVDALRLAVKLGLDVDHFGNSVVVEAWVVGIQPCAVEYNSDRYAATRRAIVRAAAEIGKAQL